MYPMREAPTPNALVQTSEFNAIREKTFLLAYKFSLQALWGWQVIFQPRHHMTCNYLDCSKVKGTFHNHNKGRWRSA